MPAASSQKPQGHLFDPYIPLPYCMQCPIALHSLPLSLPPSEGTELGERIFWSGGW